MWLLPLGVSSSLLPVNIHVMDTRVMTCVVYITRNVQLGGKFTD